MNRLSLGYSFAAIMFLTLSVSVAVAQTNSDPTKTVTLTYDELTRLLAAQIAASQAQAASQAARDVEAKIRTTFFPPSASTSPAPVPEGRK